MLEEGGESVEKMDKKSAPRATSGPPKADNKKADNGNFNRNGKFGRRREPNVARPRNEPTGGRRPVPQKAGGFDKRPRPRGYGNGRKAEEVMGEYGAEIGSALRPGAKKTNLNHLLNFTYEPRGHAAASGGRGRGPGNWSRRNNWSGKGTVKYNKEQFLQANCQFVVKEGRDYQIHAADPDTLVDWDLIEQVRIKSHEVPSCPICLYPPTAAKITRCGHIYCWPCILHYLSLGEKSWRKCPICYESVHQDDLKSVVALETRTYNVGDSITMKLLRRERGSTHTMPVKQWKPREGKPHNVEDEVDVCYAKLLVANSHQVHMIIDDEKDALTIQKMEEGDSLDGSYVDNALEKLAAREEQLKAVGNLSEQLEQLNTASGGESEGEKSSPTSTSPPVLKYNEGTRVVNYVSAFSDEEAEEEEEKAEEEQAAESEQVPAVEPIAEEEQPAPVSGSPPTTEPVDVLAKGDSPDIEGMDREGLDEAVGLPYDEIRHVPKSGGGNNQPTTEYYFYQATDGQHIYNHSINSRCLLHEYGSWENCPETITASIVELHSVSMSQELRRRLRYLGHLPVTCEFQLAELNLTPPTVSKDTLYTFRDEIEKRKKQRRQKVRDEKRMTRKSQADERKKMGLGPGLRVSLESPAHFPQYYEDAQVTAVPERFHDTDSIASSMASSNPSSPRSTPGLTPFGSPGALNPYAAEFVPANVSAAPSQASLGSDDGQQTGSLSFAQMLQAGKARPVEAWPKKGPSQVGGAGGEPWPRPRRGVSESEDSDPEDRVPVPVFQASFGSAIQQALDTYMLKKDPTGKPDNQVSVEAVPEVKGKKKKKVKKLLFTTTMARTK